MKNQKGYTAGPKIWVVEIKKTSKWEPTVCIGLTLEEGILKKKHLESQSKGLPEPHPQYRTRVYTSNGKTI